jgi:alpha-tubulin suppressor-like RCC1 family protein
MPPAAAQSSPDSAGLVLHTRRVGADADWARVSAGGSHTCGVRTDRSLWCWGYNGEGQLGLGDRTVRLVPTRVGADADWARVWGGYEHTCGVRTDRSLWCWGYNGYGQLGLADIARRLAPTRVGTDNDWAARVSAGWGHTCGVRTDRSLWCWGYNGEGALGLGDFTERHVPTRVGADADWGPIRTGNEHTCGVRTDRSLWCWGSNEEGELGLGDRTIRTVPTRVGSDADWARVWGGNEHTCGARTNRSLWCWAEGSHGQLGLDDRDGRLVPTQVGTDNDWAARVSAGWGHTCGVRTDRSLWCWGWNADGQLGLGDTTDRLVPTRV